MSHDQIVYHLLDGVDIQFAAGMRIQHGSLVDMLLLQSTSSLDGQQLNVDVGHVHSCALYGQSTHMGGMNTVTVHQTGNLNAGLCGQVADQMIGIQHVTADFIRSIGNDGLHNMSCILAGTLVILHAGLQQLCVFLFPSFDLVYAAAGILIQRNIVTVDELRIFALNIEHVVLCIVLGGLGAVVTKVVDVVQTNFVSKFRIDHLVRYAGLDFGIQIHAVLVFDLQQPAHVVDTGDQLFTAFQLIFHTQFLQQVLGANLYAVAQTNGLHAGVALHVTGQHSHGIGVVQEQCIGTYLFHVAGKISHNRNGTQGTHDTADTQGIADGLAQAVFLGHFKVDNGTGVVQTNLNGVNNKVGTAQRLFTVFNAQVALDLAIAALGLSHGFQNHAALFQALCIDIIQGKNAVAQHFAAHSIADNVTGKYGTAGTHHCNFHREILLHVYGTKAKVRLPLTSSKCCIKYTIDSDFVDCFLSKNLKCSI